LADLQAQVAQRMAAQSTQKAKSGGVAPNPSEVRSQELRLPDMRAGQTVRLVGFSNALMNGAVGTLGKKDASGDWQVFLGGATKRIKPQNLEPIAAESPAPAAGVALEAAAGRDVFVAAAAAVVPLQAPAAEAGLEAAAGREACRMAGDNRGSSGLPQQQVERPAAAATVTERSPVELREVIAQKEAVAMALEAEVKELKALLRAAEVAEAQQAAAAAEAQRAARQEYDELMRRSAALREQFGFAPQ